MPVQRYYFPGQILSVFKRGMALYVCLIIMNREENDE